MKTALVSILGKGNNSLEQIAMEAMRQHNHHVGILARHPDILGIENPYMISTETVLREGNHQTAKPDILYFIHQEGSQPDLVYIVEFKNGVNNHNASEQLGRAGRVLNDSGYIVSKIRVKYNREQNHYSITQNGETRIYDLKTREITQSTTSS